MELLSGHEKIITKSGISLNAGTLNRGFTVTPWHWSFPLQVDTYSAGQTNSAFLHSLNIHYCVSLSDPNGNSSITF
jgi:hypothetical protein